MPKVTQLVNQHIKAVKGTRIVESSEEDGETTAEEVWTLVFTDRTYGDQTRIDMNRDTRDEVVRQLTGGIVLAGGDFPKI